MTFLRHDLFATITFLRHDLFETWPFWDKTFLRHDPFATITFLRHDIFETWSVCNNNLFETWHFRDKNFLRCSLFEAWSFWDKTQPSRAMKVPSQAKLSLGTLILELKSNWQFRQYVCQKIAKNLNTISSSFHYQKF